MRLLWLLWFVAATAWDNQKDECNFDEATKFTSGLLLDALVDDINSKGFPYYCKDIASMDNNQGYNVAGHSDTYYAGWWNKCPCWQKCANQVCEFYCISGLGNDYPWCYKTTEACKFYNVPQGKYLSGCGCVKNNEGKGQDAYTCKAGDPVDCPAGQYGAISIALGAKTWYNNANRNLPLSAHPAIFGCRVCPDGKYQPSPGQSACLDCLPGYNSNEGRTGCLPPPCLDQPQYPSPVAEWGWYFHIDLKQCFYCDHCNAQKGGSVIASSHPCPTLDSTNYQTNPKTNACQQCLRCTEDGTYAVDNCVFVIADGCKAQYKNITGGMVPGSVQPFVPGYQRNSLDQGSPGKAGQPARYESCPANFLSNLGTWGMRLRTTDASVKQQVWTYNGGKVVDRTMPDMAYRDCDPNYSAECLPNHTAIWSDDKLDACTSCSPNQVSEGGLQSTCLCMAGYANQSSLKSTYANHYPDTPLAFVDNQAACVHCLYGMKGNVVMLCNLGVKPNICDQGEQPVGESCVPCAPGTGSVAGGPCEACPMGTYGPGNSGCIPCAAGTYSSVEGASQCNTTKTMCQIGYYLSPAPAQEQLKKDARCIVCAPCPLNTVKVAQKGHNGTCMGGQGEENYYACYDADTVEKMGEDWRLSYEYNSDLTVLQRFHTEQCKKEWLPDYSQYAPLGTPSVPGAQCYFACLYGVNDTAAKVYRQRVRELATADLLPFVDVVQDLSNAYASKQAWVKKVWHEYQNYWGGWEYTVFAGNGSTDSRLRTGNTFLLTDALTERNVCLAPQAVSCSDPDYVYVQPADNAWPQCALWGRDSLLQSQAQLWVLQNELIVCRATVGQKASVGQWEHSCVPKVQVLLGNALASNSNFFVHWLQPKTWYNLSLNNPYSANDNCMSSTFKVSLQSIYACIPCTDMGAAENACQLVGRPLFVGCGIGQASITQNEACKACPLPSSGEVTGADTLLLRSDPMWYQWYNGTGRVDRFNAFQNDWSTVQCRYLCQEGYMSNPSRNIYETTNWWGSKPCVSCNTTINCPPGSASYLPQTQLHLQNTYCGPKNMQHWNPATIYCETCTPILTFNPDTMRFVQRSDPPVYANEDCPARCSSNFSKTKVNGILQSTAVVAAQKSLLCETCDNTTEVCTNSGVCIPGYFRPSAGLCRPCNSTPCNVSGYFRTQCTDGIHDSVCAPCNTSWLYNPQPCPSDLCSAAQTRRWVLPTQMLGVLQPDANAACYVSCVNNHMWIDTNINGNPTNPLPLPTASLSATNSLFCAPCDGPFVRQKTMGGLYAVWNYQQGKCLDCPYGYATTMDNDTMCNLMANFSNSFSQTAFAQVQVVRRKSSGAAVVITVPSYAASAPSLQPGTSAWYYNCCSVELGLGNTTDAFKRCSAQTDECYAKMNKEQPPSQGCCSNTTARTGRRLLQVNGFQAGETYTCPAGSFKNNTGVGACMWCPQGSSTLWNGSTSLADCICFPGHWWNAEFKRCDECPMNTCRGQREDSCKPCRLGWTASASQVPPCPFGCQSWVLTVLCCRAFATWRRATTCPTAPTTQRRAVTAPTRPSRSALQVSACTSLPPPP